MTLRAPFPWFGGKSRVAPLVWERFGDVRNYVEPFAGSLAVLLGRPSVAGLLSDRVQESIENPHGLVGVEAQHRKGPVLAHGGGRRVLRHESHDDAVKVSSERPLLSGKGNGIGVNKVSLTRQIDDLAGDSGAVGRGFIASGFDLRTGGIYAYMEALAQRLRRVRVCCGDWSRVVTPAVTTCIATTAVMLDPPYHSPGTERSAVYTHDDDAIWNETKDWAVANGDNPELRIALCGYEGDHNIPDSWDCVHWKASGGYGRSERGRRNRERERIWFSPNCLPVNAVQHSLLLNDERLG